MNEDSSMDPDVDIETRLNGQTGRIVWEELQRYYARGVVREVAQGLDLIEVGKVIIANDSERVEGWIERGELSVPDEQRALQWHGTNAEMWALVIAPWVLVQVA